MDWIMAEPQRSIDDLLEDIPAGTWVAISVDQHRVMALGDDPNEVTDRAREQGEAVPLILRAHAQSMMMAI